MGDIGVTIKSTEISQHLMNDFHPGNWTQFEADVLRFLKQQLAGLHVQTVRVNILNSNRPGPLLIKFDVVAQGPITAAELKQVLRT
jgi:hypothetical protein